MKSSTYCGASEEHIHYNNHKLKPEEPIKLFGIDGTDEKTIWLDMKNCLGTLDSTTFSLLPNVEYLSMQKCNFESCSEAFSPLEKLTTVQITKCEFPVDAEIFKDSKGITSLYIHDIQTSIHTFLQHLNKLESISIESCNFEIINRDLFTGLTSLKRLSISNCQIGIVNSDAFIDLINLEGVNIRDTEINEINLDVFSKLTNLKFLSFHHNKIESKIDYSNFEQLESLDTIHFDTDVYKTLNFDNFGHLENVKIGYNDDNEDDPEIEEMIENVKSKNIKTEYVFCGNIDYNSDEMEECY